ncbi:hypothetical protein [Xanthomonas oryzae]|uniref:hypothetical protein n=1 Tax=Xanthomonas oryzae TaxID=347 RepID=UPI001035339F|nr:hypothetical protein [Xanthomonas oryzae]QBG99183.1 hypothetical protein EYC56_07075 [Xanthomonas oryzae]
MKTILLLTCLLFFLNGPALAHNNERVINAKCDLSYLVPSGFKEIKISDAILVPGKCALAFDRRYAPKSPFKGPYPTDEIRASVDFFIQVDIFSVATAIKKNGFSAADQNANRVCKKLDGFEPNLDINSSNFKKLDGGELYEITMIDRKKPGKGKKIYLAGNDKQSLSYTTWFKPGRERDALDQKNLDALFSSIKFDD